MELDYILLKGVFIVVGLSIILFILLSIGSIYSDLKGKTYHWVEEGNCYDKFGNKINEVICDIEKSCSEYNFNVYNKCNEEDMIKINAQKGIKEYEK
ncbi:MAG: hypothetical protein WC758_08160 [Candidatus Woesearchaeota archaeon]|jgi:uncharacterized protein YxeA